MAGLEMTVKGRTWCDPKIICGKDSCIVFSTDSICCSTADSVDDAEKWLTGLELLRQETLVAHTPEIIERYTHTHTQTDSVPCV